MLLYMFLLMLNSAYGLILVICNSFLLIYCMLAGAYYLQIPLLMLGFSFLSMLQLVVHWSSEMELMMSVILVESLFLLPLLGWFYLLK